MVGVERALAVVSCIGCLVGCSVGASVESFSARAEGAMAEGDGTRVVRGGAWLFRSDDSDAVQQVSGCMSRYSSHAIADVHIAFGCVHDP
jgi:hypothetical protein